MWEIFMKNITSFTKQIAFGKNLFHFSVYVFNLFDPTPFSNNPNKTSPIVVILEQYERRKVQIKKRKEITFLFRESSTR